MIRRQLISLAGALTASSLGWWWLRKDAAAEDRHDIIRSVFSANALPAFTAQHLLLIRQLRVNWVPEESGAPGIDPVEPLWHSSANVNTSTEADSALSIALHILQTTDRTRATRLLAEVCLLIPEFVASAMLPAGNYSLPSGFAQPRQRLLANQLFQFLPAHQSLLNAAQWREVSSDSIEDLLSDEDPNQPLWPMPYIDGKRPYGDRSYYQIDMAELLGQPYVKNAQGKYILSPNKDQALASLHQQTQAALQVLFMYGTPGTSIQG